MIGGAPLFIPFIHIPRTPMTEAFLLSIPTSWHRTGISVLYGDNLCVSNRNASIGFLGEKIESYSHEIRAIGGFYSATITFKDNESNLRDWLQNGIGRHIEVYDQAGEMVWEGFVDKIDCTIENISISRGPLISADVGNKVKVRYSIVDYSISPPSVGITATSAYTNDTTSQSKYGIIEKVISLNEVTTTLASQVRNSWLREHAFPQSSITSIYAQNSEPSITLNCLGYWHYLNTWIYFEDDPGSSEVTEKIMDILGDSPNDIFSGDVSFIESNTTEVKSAETSDKTALSLISDLVTMSDSSNNKYIAGFYGGRVFKYGPVPETIGYYQETGGVIKNTIGRPVLPWSVQPGNWIYYSGLLPDSSQLSTLDDLYQSPVTAFIESAAFSSPYEVSLTTQRLSKLDQLFSRMGITSV